MKPTPIPTERRCARPGCGAFAEASLGYSYNERQAWLDDLGPEAEPYVTDVCDVHADRLSAPRGWTLEDRRARTRPLLTIPLAG